MAVYVPSLRVPLETWCNWTGAPWDKVQAVVGRSFRVCAPDENAYTMAAAAVLRLIDQYDIDPSRVGSLSLGTESSTDNAAGSVIVKGMVDDALRETGRPPLSRYVEVPEIKQACLAGIYGLKNACRYLSCDGKGRVAIVVASDVAEYARGSTGEQTQGAGAVAMLVEEDPQMFEVDLMASASSADYRGFDFRKPFARHFIAPEGHNGSVPRDYPVFNGKYSTTCYVDEVVHAVGRLLERADADESYFEDVAAILLHRPYHRLPVQAMASVMIWVMGRSAAGRRQLGELCSQAQVDAEAVLGQVSASPDIFSRACQEGPDFDPSPDATKLVKFFGRTPQYKAFARDKLGLGSELVKDLGNLYTASLPAWIAAAFTDGFERDLDLDGKTMLTVGYGSGDAAEAVPIASPRAGERPRRRSSSTARSISTRISISRRTPPCTPGRPPQTASSPRPGRSASPRWASAPTRPGRTSGSSTTATTPERSPRSGPRRLRGPPRSARASR